VIVSRIVDHVPGRKEPVPGVCSFAPLYDALFHDNCHESRGNGRHDFERALWTFFHATTNVIFVVVVPLCYLLVVVVVVVVVVGLVTAVAN